MFIYIFIYLYTTLYYFKSCILEYRFSDLFTRSNYNFYIGSFLSLFHFIIIENTLIKAPTENLRYIAIIQ